MKIKKSSWHYRLLNVFTEAPDNRCTYIRKFFSVALVLLIVKYVIGSLIAFPFLVYFFDFETIPWYGQISMTVGFVVCAFFIIFIGTGITSFLLDQYPRSKKESTGTIKQWFKDRADWLCEPIEFVDE